MLAASANSQEVLGIDAHSLLGSDLFQTDTSPFDAATLADLRRCLESEDPAAHAPLLATVRRASCTHSGCSPHVFLIVHITQDGYVIDVEPFSEDTPSVLKVLHTAMVVEWQGCRALVLTQARLSQAIHR